MIALFKSLLPDHPVPMRIWRGPFRGARVMMNPRNSLRKVCGLYERELNAWIEAALRRVTCMLDVGANDGYFTFGCAAAFQRLGVNGRITGFEPDERQVEVLRSSIDAQQGINARIDIVPLLVGREVSRGMTTLDAFLPECDRRNTLIKVDVEGAELDVIDGARSWMNASNLFLIEVHKEEYLDRLRRLFAEYGIALEQIDQRPLPLLGREKRETGNWWMVSDLGTQHA